MGNFGFEKDWSEGKSHQVTVFLPGGRSETRTVGNIFVPPDWHFWFYHDPGEYDQPEARDAHIGDDPYRVSEGAKAFMYFTFFRKMHAGLYQQIQVRPGAVVSVVSAMAHAWSNTNIEGHEGCNRNARCSSGVGKGPVYIPEGDAPPLNGDPWNDAVANFTFWVGIDPTGGTNPFASTVTWGDGAHIYNEHHSVPPVSEIAQSSSVTIFLRAKTLWPFRNNDAYWDDIVIEVDGGDCPEAFFEYPENITAGDTVSVYVKSHLPLTSVHLEVQQAYVVGSGAGKDDDGLWWWRWSVTYHNSGGYTMAFTADGIEPVVAVLDVQQVKPEPDPPPPPRGQPRIDYQRTYVLLPPGYGAGWAIAVIDGAWDTQRFTIGGSADDAGIGDLDARYIIAVNPQGWPGGEIALDAFFSDHYPGTIYSPLIVTSPADLSEQLAIWKHSDPGPKPEPDPDPTTPILYGLHDKPGGDEMAKWGVTKGVCLAHWNVDGVPEPRDFSNLADTGITVIGRVQKGYAGGPGTYPPPDDNGDPPEKWLDDLTTTILETVGVSWWHIGCEPNNDSEMPGFNQELHDRGLRDYPGFVRLTPQYTTSIYNIMRDRLGAAVRLCLPPLDPYFGPGSDNSEWWRYLLANCLKPAALVLHGGKSQTNDPADITSEVKFEHPPLQWQYLNSFSFKTYLAMVAALKNDWRDLPVFLTELNPQHLEVSGGPTGWKRSNAAWIYAMDDMLQTHNATPGMQLVTGGMFYRWEPAGNQEPFGLAVMPDNLAAIKTLCLR